MTHEALEWGEGGWVWEPETPVLPRWAALRLFSEPTGLGRLGGLVC